ncbi:autoinducer synthase, partial [Mesorhizobium sp. M5C.F.Ca.IN.020.32.2.1]
FVVPEKRSTGLRGTLTQLCCAVMEYALDEGLSAIGGVQETYFMPHHGALKWRAEPMGMAREENGEWYIVAYIEVNEAALASVRRILGIGHSLLVRRGRQVPFINNNRVAERALLSGTG